MSYIEDEEIEDSRLVKDLRAQIKALGKERDEAVTRATELAGTVRKSSVADLLGSKGVDKKLARFAIADGVEDEAGLTAWLAENGEVFGVKAPEPAVSADDQAAMEAVQNATSTGEQTATALTPALKAFEDAQTPEEWKAAALAARAGA